ncbi:MAG: gamma-glutamyltransferase [Alphaproteobacteria bacterium]
MISRTIIKAKQSTPKCEDRYMFARLSSYCTRALVALALVFTGACQKTKLFDQASIISDVTNVVTHESDKERIHNRVNVQSIQSNPFQGIASDEPHAALVGRDVLEAGGSAADAVVAMYFTLAVTLPSTASLGGGGVCIIHESKSGRTETLEFTATAPTVLPPTTTRPSATPGAVRGISELHRRYGRANWGNLIKPAEQLARFGVPVSRALASDLKLAAGALFMDPNARFIFARTDGTPLNEGDNLKQFDLAWVLTRLRRYGAGDFYAGQVSAALIRGAERSGGSLSHMDLRNTQALWQEAVGTNIGDFTVFTSPPPTAGAITAMQIWSMIAADNRYPESNEIERRHLFAEASMRAFQDRGITLFSDGATAVPVTKLLDQKHLGQLMSNYKPNGHTALHSSTGQPRTNFENPSATSFLVADKDGLAIACLISLHNLFGIGRIAEETGIVLATAPTQQGMGPQSLAPMVVLDRASGDLKMIAAATGGAAAPTALAWTAINVFLENMTLSDAINGPRMHHGGRPDHVLFEPGSPSKWLIGLERRGHSVLTAGEIGQINAFHCEVGLAAGNKCFYSSDPRGHGLAIGLNP